jgi:DNA-binding transcriptional ArsR family regulator
MMRIHFTLTDVARTRLADVPSALTATTFGAFRLVTRRPDRAEIDLWRRLVRAELGTTPRPLLAALAATSPADPVPRLLRPAEGLHSLDSELERLLSTPREELRSDFAYVAGHRPLPPVMRRLAEGEPRALAALARSVRRLHGVALAPYWRGLSALMTADRAARTRALRDGGVEQLLGTLHPHMRWRPPVLELTSVRAEFDYHLGGRGLLLTPAAFTSYVPCDPGERQPTLYYEVGFDRAEGHPLAAPLRGPFGGLAALLGHGRAAVLEALAEELSTSELADRVGLASATASEHAGVLRRAGLVTSRHAGRSRLHTLTPLGADLLRQAAAD